MALFIKQDDHAGSGLDQPRKRGLIRRLVDAMRRPAAPQNPAAPAPSKSPSTP